MNGHKEHRFTADGWRFGVGSTRCHRWCESCGSVRQWAEYHWSEGEEGGQEVDLGTIYVEALAGADERVCVPSAAVDR